MLEQAGLVGDELRQNKNDYKTGGFFYGSLIAPKIKFCLSVDIYGILQKH